MTAIGLGARVDHFSHPSAAGRGCRSGRTDASARPAPRDQAMRRRRLRLRQAVADSRVASTTSTRHGRGVDEGRLVGLGLLLVAASRVKKSASAGAARRWRGASAFRDTDARGAIDRTSFVAACHSDDVAAWAMYPRPAIKAVAHEFTGRRIVAVTPWPSPSLAKAISPPWPSTIARAMARPKPVLPAPRLRA